MSQFTKRASAPAAKPATAGASPDCATQPTRTRICCQRGVGPHAVYITLMQQPGASSIHPQLASGWSALAAFLFNRQRYVELAVSHLLAVNLESSDLAVSFRQGTYPPNGWELEQKRKAAATASVLTAHLRRSFFALLMISLTAVLILFFTGSISTNLSLAWSKVLSAMGAFLAAWATLFELGGLPRTWSGRSLHEVMHPKLFAALFLTGTFLAMLGQLW